MNAHMKVEEAKKSKTKILVAVQLHIMYNEVVNYWYVREL